MRGDQDVGSEEFVVMHFSKMRRLTLEEESQNEVSGLGLEW